MSHCTKSSSTKRSLALFSSFWRFTLPSQYKIHFTTNGLNKLVNGVSLFIAHSSHNTIYFPTFFNYSTALRNVNNCNKNDNATLHSNENLVNMLLRTKISSKDNKKIFLDAILAFFSNENQSSKFDQDSDATNHPPLRSSLQLSNVEYITNPVNLDEELPSNNSVVASQENTLRMYLNPQDVMVLANHFQVHRSDIQQWFIEARYKWRQSYGSLTADMKLTLKEAYADSAYRLSKPELQVWSKKFGVGPKKIANFLAFQRLRGGSLPKALKADLLVLSSQYTYESLIHSKLVGELSNKYHVNFSKIQYYLYQIYYRRKNRVLQVRSKNKDCKYANISITKNLKDEMHEKKSLKVDSITKSKRDCIRNLIRSHFRNWKNNNYNLQNIIGENNSINPVPNSTMLADGKILQKLSSEQNLPYSVLHEYARKYLHDLEMRSGVLSSLQRNQLKEWYSSFRNVTSLTHKDWEDISEKVGISISRAKSFIKHWKYRNEHRSGRLSSENKTKFRQWLQENEYCDLDADTLSIFSKETNISPERIREYMYKYLKYQQKKMKSTNPKSIKKDVHLKTK